MSRESANAPGVCTPDRGTAQVPRARTLGVWLGSARSVVRSNPTVHGFRERAAAALERALGSVKLDALAAGMNATRTLVARWLDPAQVDRRPAPLALLLSLDDGDFEAVVAELRRERGA